MRRTLLARLIAPAVALVVALAASGATGGVAMIQPRVERAVFGRMLDGLEIDDQQRLVVEMIFQDYLVALDGLGGRLDAEAGDAGAARVQDALGGRIILHPDELRRLRLAVLEVERTGWSEADRLMEELLLDTREVLFGVTEDALDRGMRELRREVWLRPRRAEERDERYAGDGVDVMALLDAATASDGELAGFDMGSVTAPLMAYADGLDALLLATAVEDRDGRMAWRRARIQGDPASQQDEEAAHLERWSRLYELNGGTARAIESEAARQLGPEAASRWRSRFNRACFPWLFRSVRPDREFAWIERRVPDASVLGEAREVHDRFRTAHDVACARTIDLIVDARREAGVILAARMDPRGLKGNARTLYQRMLRISGERAALEADASTALNALLTDRQAKQMRADIAASAYGRRR